MEKCTCKNCGKQFNKGDEADNETICLRCDRESLLTSDSFDEIEYEHGGYDAEVDDE